MTVDEIIAELESLKEFVNDTKKPALDALKAAVKALAEPKLFPLVLERDVVESKPEPVKDEGFLPLNIPKKKRAYKRKVK